MDVIKVRGMLSHQNRFLRSNKNKKLGKIFMNFHRNDLMSNSEIVKSVAPTEVEENMQINVKIFNEP